MVTSIKTVAVHGATGQQGGGTVRALAAAGFTVRALVRDATAAKALALAPIPGVELVAIDLTKVESIIAAYSEADAVFALTQSFTDELTPAKLMVEAAKATNIKLFVWSSIVSATKVSNGRFTVPHFEAKAEIAEYIEQSGVPLTVMNLCAFVENYINIPGQGIYNKETDTITICLGGVNPETVVPKLRAKVDVGNAVKVILEHPEDFVGQTVNLGDLAMSQRDEAKIIEAVSGKKAVAYDGPKPFLANTPPSLLAMFEFMNSINLADFTGVVPDPLLKKHGYKASSFESFVKEELLPFFQL